MTRKLLCNTTLPWLTLGVAIVFGIWLRLDGVFARPLWLDEGYSAYIADQSYGFIWHVVPQFETHPPFYYTLLRTWTLIFGDSLVARRGIGLLAGLATLPVAALAIREIAGHLGWSHLRTNWAMAIVAALIALSEQTVEMTRLARPYPVLILVYAAALLGLFRAARLAAQERRLAPGPFALYAVMLAAVLWLHNLGLFYGASLGLAMLVMLTGQGLRLRDWLHFAIGHVLAGLVYVPAFLMLLDQSTAWIRQTWLVFDTSTLPWDLSLLVGAPGKPGLALALLLGMSGIWRLGQVKSGWRIAIALLITAFVPTLLSIAVSLLKSPVFLTRTLSGTTIAATLLIALGVAGARGIWRWPAGLALLVLMIVSARFDLHEHRRPPSQDWYGAADWLAAHLRDGDEIWIYPNEGALPLQYAAHDHGHVAVIEALHPIPTPIPARDDGPGASYPTGNRAVVRLSYERLRAIAQTNAALSVPRIWLLRLGPDTFDPQNDLLRALDEGRTRCAGCESYPSEIIGFARGTVRLPPAPPSRMPEFLSKQVCHRSIRK